MARASSCRMQRGAPVLLIEIPGAEPMKTSKAGLDLIKEFEGRRLQAYLCPAGRWTIGYGNTSAARPGLEISEAEADSLLEQDVARFEEAVHRLVKVPLSQPQFDALVSFAFNVGEGNLRSSTLLRMLNEGRYGAVPSQLARWDKASVSGQKVQLAGLARRRAAEAALWASDGVQVVAGHDVDPVPDRRLQDTATGRGIGVTGVGAVGTLLIETGRDLGLIVGGSPTLTAVMALIVLAGVGITVWGAMRRINRQGA